MKYWIAVHYGDVKSQCSVVCGQERTKAEAERQIAYWCGYHTAKGLTIFKVELERLDSVVTPTVLEVPMQIAMWTCSE